MKSLSLSQPHVLIMVGVPGSGKSFFAEKFAETFGAPYVTKERINALLDGNTEVANKIVDIQLDELFKTKQSIILDGVATTRVNRSDTVRKAKSAGYEALLVWVQIDPTTAKSRVIKSQAMTPDEYERELKHFMPPSPHEKSIVISGKHTYATQAKVVLKKLSEPRSAIPTHDIAPIRNEPSGRRNITIR